MTVAAVHTDPSAKPNNGASKITARLNIALDARPGVRTLRVVTPLGPSDGGSFDVGLRPETPEQEPNDRLDQAQRITLPATVVGKIDPAEDVDTFRFSAEKGIPLVFDVFASRIGAPLDPVLILEDAAGHELAYNDDFYGPDSFLVYTPQSTGDYCVVLHDVSYHGGPDYVYRMDVGPIPYIASYLPLGGRPGETLTLSLDGWNLGGAATARVTVPANAQPGALTLPLDLAAGVTNDVTLLADDTPWLVAVEPNGGPTRPQAVTVPVSIDGRLAAPTETHISEDGFRFHAEKNHPLNLEIFAERLGSRMDSVLEVRDASGHVVAQNDDAVGKDSRLQFSPPATADYVACVFDRAHGGGPDYTYRLRIAPPRPDFRLSFYPARIAVGQGGRTALTVTANRIDGFDGQIDLALQGLPSGVSVLGQSRIAAGADTGVIVLSAPSDARPVFGAVTLDGSASLDGKVLARTARPLDVTFEGRRDGMNSGIATDTRPSDLAVAGVAVKPDLVVTCPTAAVSLAPGKSANIAVHVERAAGFAAKAALWVYGLPGGITAADADVPEKQSDGKVTLKMEGSVPPGDYQIVVVAQSVIDDSHRSTFASEPIRLTVAAK